MAGTQQSCSVILLGATGKLGRMVCAVWRPKDFAVVPVTRIAGNEGVLHWQPGMPFPEIGTVVAVVALWGVTPGADRQLGDNRVLADAAMRLGEELGVSAVVHCSSAAVYGPSAAPVGEETEPDPQSAYGRSKLQMEQDIAARATHDGPRQIILRIGNVAGADGLFASLSRGDDLTLDQFPNGEYPQRSYIAAGDLAKVIEGLIASPVAKGVFNVAAPGPTKMADIISAAGRSFVPQPAPAGALPMMWLDTAKVSNFFALHHEAAEAGYLVNSARNTGVWP